MEIGPVFSAWSERVAPKLLENLKSRNFEAYYCATAQEAAQKALTLIDKGDTVSWGGSVTLSQLGLPETLTAQGYQVIDRDTASSPEERVARMRQALTCGTFLTSVNAVSLDGVLVNVDGVGNRVAAMAFGPRQVIVVVGLNKLCPTVEDALVRVRRTVAPINVTRMGLQRTPCAQTGVCSDCKTDECVCSYIVQTRMNRVPGRVKIIVVGEPLGY